MQAIVRTKPGKEFSTMALTDLPSPSPKPGEVLIKMKASRINPVDMDLMKGFPTLKYKQPQIGGVDGAGVILATGPGVTQFNTGDAVMFYRKFTDIGTWAEEITISVKDIAKIPSHLSPAEAGGIALPLLTAFESLRSINPKAHSRILIHGAGGGVGFQAVQLSKAMGLEVIANGGSRDADQLKNAGVAQFIDYKSADFFEVLRDNPPEYVMDVIGKDTLMKSIALRPEKVVSIAYPDTNKMRKTGVQLPWLLKTAMKMMNRKFKKAALKQQVQLIGQVTGANGPGLDEAARFMEKHQLIAPQTRKLQFSDLLHQGLSAEDLGKVMLFES